MKVLVTGGSGKLGEHVVRELAQHRHEVLVFDLQPPSGVPLPFMRGDITDLTAVEQAARGQEAIVHLAAVPYETGEAERIARANVLGTFTALEAAARNKVARFVFASSMCAYGFFFAEQPVQPAWLPIDEEHPCTPRDNYGTSKLLGERWCQAYAARYHMKVTCLRLATVWFPNSQWTSRLLERLEGRESQASDSLRDAWWQYVDARDAAQAFRLALERPAEFAVFNIGAREPPFGVDPATLARQLFGAVPVREKVAGGLYSIVRAVEVLGYEPQHHWREHIPSARVRSEG